MVDAFLVFLDEGINCVFCLGETSISGLELVGVGYVRVVGCSGGDTMSEINKNNRN